MKTANLIRLVWVLLISLSVVSCDQSDKTQAVAAPAAATPAAPATTHPTPVNTTPDAAQLEKLTKLSAGKPLTLLDASEVQLEGASALVLTFSIPLDPNQDFSRVVHLVDKTSGKVDGAWELSQDLKELRLRHLEPKRDLLLTLDSGLVALNKEIFANQFEKKITTRDIQPSVGFASRGSLLPVKVITGLPVMALNVDKVDVNFYRVKSDSLAEFLSEWNYRNSVSSWQSDRFLKLTDLVYTGRFDLNPQRNTREKVMLPLSDIKTLQQPGVYIATMNEAGRYNDSNPTTLFTLSDIGLSVHRYHDRLDLFTQSLENGAAQSDVAITLINEKGQSVAQTKSDSNGHATLEKLQKGVLLLAQSNDQTTLLDLTRPALDLAEFDIAGDAGYSKQFFMFGPRDLYRPGETVLLNALLRDSDGQPLPDQPVKLEVVKPDGQVTKKQVWQAENGLYQFSLPLSPDSQTGDWQIRVNTGDNQPRAWTFKVEDFMPERMALNITTQQQPVSPEDTVNFNIKGRYLYGAPASGNNLQGQLFLRPLREAVSALPGFQFGDINEENLSRSLDTVQLHLDEKGKATVSAESQWAEAQSPLRLVLQASLLESGGRPVTRRAEQVIWPADNLPGIRPQFASREVYDYRTDVSQMQPMVDENSDAGFDIVYTNAEGEKLAVSDLDVRLIKERRDYYWSWEESQGWQSQYDQKDLVEAQQKLNLAEGEVGRVAFPVEWGSYRLEVRAPDSGLVSSVRFWAGYNWQDNSDGTRAARPDRVLLKLDKPNYKPGDTLNLHIVAPAAGKGYVMVESSDGPLWWKSIDVPAQGMDLAIPIDKNWQRHDIYLSTLVVRPGDKSQAVTPKRAVGILHLPLGDTERRLDIALTGPEKMRPNQNLTVRVKANTPDGEIPKKINVLLSAVDTGVLNITDYKTPDPWDAFFGRKRYGADLYDIYGQLIEGQGKLAALRFGGDGDKGDALSRGGKKPVNHVTIIAQQAQAVQLDERGEGTVTLPIGDFNGELRVMAQAWSDTQFGNSEEKVVVAAPLVAEMAMPRFIASGDSSRLALDVTNLTNIPQQLAVNLQASGLISLETEQPLNVKLAAGARTTLFIPVRAQEGFGDGVINAQITGLNLPGETVMPQQKQWKLGVRPAFPAQTVSNSAVLRPGEVWNIPSTQLSGLVSQTVEGKLLLSGHPPLNLARYIQELKAYPYGCLEQTTSGLFPSLYSSEAQLAALGIKGTSDIQRRAAIDFGISRLFDMQRESGGFGLWSKESPEEYWLTAYVVDFLIRANEQGYSVDPEALNRANQQLLRYLQDPELIKQGYSNDPNASQFAIQAYAGLVLARQQKVSLGALREVWEHRDAAKSGLPLVQLGIALKLMGDAPRSQQAIDLGLQTERSDRDIWLDDYGSDLRDKAMILNLLEENDILPDQQNQLLLTLSDLAYGQRWLSTQETNALYLAGRNWQNTQQSWQAEGSFTENQLTATQSVTYSLSADELSELQVTNTGQDNLYLRLDSVGYPEQAPAPYNNKLHIERHFLNDKGESKSLSTLKSGELVMVWLDVWADREIPDALVVDLLPAGFELENQNLSDSSASMDETDKGVQALRAKMGSSDIQHIEFRDDRFVAALHLNEGQHATLIYLARAVTPGSYVMPVSQVESMYVPQLRATGTSIGTVTITP